MSHPKTVQYAKFYNAQPKAGEVPSEVPPLIAPWATMPSTTKLRTREQWESALHPPFYNDVGFSFTLSKKVDASLLDPPQNHKIVYGPLGIKTAHEKRVNIFTQLPGRTFNAKTWQTYSLAATQSIRAKSPMKKS